MASAQPGKVAIFSTCYVNYNEPGIGHDLLKVLEHNEIPTCSSRRKPAAACPSWSWATWRRGEAQERQHPGAGEVRRGRLGHPQRRAQLHADVQAGAAADVPGDADVAAVQAAMWDPFEYLIARHKDGLLKTDFKQPLGKVSYHIPCHGRVQNIGKKTEEMFKLIGEGEVQLNTVERCSGHAGTYGVKKPPPMAMKIGKPVFKAMAKDEPDYIGSDCPMAGHHIAQGMAGNGAPAAKIAHPLSLLRIAYGDLRPCDGDER
jgi:Fe-S oxidoreductase